MANDTLNFHCPACGIHLTVPASMAGIKGPCPSCRNEIQAPDPIESLENPALAPGPLPTWLPPVEVVSDPVVLISEPSELPPECSDFPPLPSAPAITGETAESLPKVSTTAPRPVDPAILRIELCPGESVDATPPSIPESVSEHLQEHFEDFPRQRTVPPTSSSPWTARLIRILLPLLFFVLMAATVFGILTFVSSRTKKEPTPAPVTLPAPLPDPPASTNPVMPGQGSSTAPDATISGEAANAVLEKFLAAQSLAERLPLLETKTTESEMAESCLARPLPEARNIALDSQGSNPSSPFTDFHFHVDFATTDNRLNTQTLLVRTRGGNPPKIVVDPFLDSFGGRLADFAAAPAKQTELFQVVVLALASCNNAAVPHSEEKFTLKLLPRENETEISVAYCGRQSRIGLMLENGAYGLKFDLAKACTVMLRWNSEDNPQTPYLEALEIKSLDWNP